MNRWACTDDLKNYFRIRDLLGGLTEPQKRQLRENIGVSTGEGGQSVPLSITYSTLKSIISQNQLTTGARYLITDFQTIYSNKENVTWGTDQSDYPSEKYTLIVTAISDNKLDPRIVILEHPEWTVEYDVNSEILPDTTTTKGKITYLKDDNNNSAYYDFKNIRYIRQYQGNSVAFFTFSSISDGVVSDYSNNDLVHDNEICENSYDNVFIGVTYYNKFNPNCYGNTFFKGCHDTSLDWESINNTFYEPVIFVKGVIANRTIPSGEDLLSDPCTKILYNVDGNVLMVNFDKDTYAQQITLIPENYSRINITGNIYTP